MWGTWKCVRRLGPDSRALGPDCSLVGHILCESFTLPPGPRLPVPTRPPCMRFSTTILSHHLRDLSALYIHHGVPSTPLCERALQLPLPCPQRGYSQPGASVMYLSRGWRPSRGTRKRRRARTRQTPPRVLCRPQRGSSSSRDAARENESRCLSEATRALIIVAGAARPRRAKPWTVLDVQTRHGPCSGHHSISAAVCMLCTHP